MADELTGGAVGTVVWPGAGASDPDTAGEYMCMTHSFRAYSTRMDEPWEWSPEVRHQFNCVLRDVRRVDDERLRHKLDDDLMQLMNAAARLVDGVIHRAIDSTP